MKNLRLNRFLIMGSILIFSIAVWAEDATPKNHEFVLSTGASFGTYRGDQVSGGTFNSNINVQGEVWIFNSSQKALVLNSILSNETSLGRTRYFGAGAGQRYFVFSDGLITEKKSGTDFFYMKPSWSYYFGWDVGLGQFLVVPYTSSLASYSTLVSFGGTIGVKKNFSSDYSFNAQAAYSFGNNILSTTAVSVGRFVVLAGIGYAF